jgi:cell division protein FtsQ
MKAAAAEAGMFEGIQWGRFSLWLVAGIVLMVSILLAWRTTEDFLIKDNRFRIAEAEDYPGQSPDLIVEGIHYASASQIRHVFAEDLGRSLYLVPIQKRREQLLEIDWVEDATVSKVWPKTVKAHVTERVPVAFVHLPPNTRDGMSRLALIDREGVILRPRVAAKFTLPVITGIRQDEILADRRARVRRVLGMLKEVGSLSAQISEINVADPNNLIVEEHVDSGVLTLLMGDENYADRLQNFLSNYPEIKARRPDATTIDLRVDGVITAVGDDKRGQ